MLATDVFRVVKLAVCEFINPSCEVNVLFVDVINDDRLEPFTLIKPSCVATDVFNVETLAFNDDILAVCEFIKPSWEVNVLFVDVINDDMLEPFTLIKPSCVETDTFNVEILEPFVLVKVSKLERLLL